MPMALRRRLEIRLRSRQENRSLAIGEGGSAERLQCIFRTGVPSSVACARWLRARRSELSPRGITRNRSSFNVALVRSMRRRLLGSVKSRRI